MMRAIRSQGIPLVLLCASFLSACTPNASVNSSVLLVTTTPILCPQATKIIQSFYDANDTAHFDDSLALLTEDITYVTWAEGINGHHMLEKHYNGKDQIRPVLANPGLRRSNGEPDSPVFHEVEFKVSGETIRFLLRPDRKRPNGRLYNPYGVEAKFNGCKIQSLTVIEYVTWL
jgi:ketosteroid isomerase-like protein